ncbi:MAG: hypothetical protein II943_04695 [Victivallales bacterium]|nr:hypothetical protein [Victivallales bacterium]
MPGGECGKALPGGKFRKESILENWAWALGIAMAAVLVFHEGMQFGFLNDWDDMTFIQDNPRIAFTWENWLFYAMHPFQDLYTPLPMWSLMLDHALFGLRPFAYHLHNLILHVLGAWVLMAVLKKLGVRTALAGLGALLWALNPQKVESVIWVSERKDVLCGVFAFGAMWCFLARKTWLCAICTALAIFAKPAALALPGIYVVWQMADLGPERKYRPWWPAGMGVAAGIVSMLVTKQTNPGTIEKSLMVPFQNFFWYPLTSLVPFETNPFYPEIVHPDWHFFGVVAGGGVLLGIGCIWARRLNYSWRSVCCALLILFGAMFPVLGLLHYTNFRYCDRYNYLVSAVTVVCFAKLAEGTLRRWEGGWLKRIVYSGMGWIAVSYGCLAYLYVPYWENCLKLSYYSLQRPGRPNLKAYEMGVMAGFRMGATDFLSYLREELPKRPPISHFDSQESIQSFLLFMDVHEAFLQGRDDEAEKAFQRLATQFAQKRQNGNAVVVALPPVLIQWLYVDMADIALRRGELEKADFYRRAMRQ